jgi:hypothetical protein
MIHRINSVAPDLDDRVIKPNQARSAYNLRFGASTEDSNLSGGVLFNGNRKIEYQTGEFPIGENQIIGVREDYENQVIYFALYNKYIEPDTYNEFHDHGIYKVSGSSNKISRIVHGAWLNFVDDGDVSMTSIDDKLYWTDGLNPPRMVNISKAIAGGYPANFQEWYYTQIKRPPGLPPYVTPFKFITRAASIDGSNIFDGRTGWQFSYYYTYDNYEESRLGPVSPMIWSSSVNISVPPVEFNKYLNSIDIVKEVVFVFREGNDGTWYILKKIKNLPQNYVNNVIYFSISNINFIAKTAVNANITNAQFDGVPLTSTCNIIAQSRLFHSNYKTDYPNWNNLTLTLKSKELISSSGSVSVDTLQFNRSFMYGSYKIGVELLDEWGRRIGVVNSQTVKIDWPSLDVYSLNYPTLLFQQSKPSVSQGNDNNVLNNSPVTWIGSRILVNGEYTNPTVIDYEIINNFPDWARYYRIVYTKCLDYNYFYKSYGRVYYWYTSNNENFFSSVPYFAYENTTIGNISFQYPTSFTPVNLFSEEKNRTYTFKGYGVELSSQEPFEYNADSNQYLRIAREWEMSNDANAPSKTAPYKEYKIEGASGNLLLIKTNDELLSTFNNATPPDNSYSIMDSRMVSAYNLYYNIYLYSKKQQIDETYYQSTAIQPIDGTSTILTGTLDGDCYRAYYKKTAAGSSISILNAYLKNKIVNVEDLKTDGSSTNIRTWASDSKETEGWCISMNPTNIYSPNWNSDIGQSNAVNEDQKEIRLKNWITFSDPIALGSQINGLNKFLSLNAQAMPSENGPITGIVTTNATQGQPGVMLAIGSLGIQSIYLGAVQITGVDGDSTLSLSNNVMGTNRPLLGQFGTSRFRSISTTPMSTIYWWSDVVNDVIRYTNAGLEKIGNTYSFGNAIRQSLFQNPSIITAYDQVTDEVLVLGRKESSFVFSERFKTFQGNRDLMDLNTVTPERMISLSTKSFAFLRGEVWVSEINSAKNFVFGSIKAPSVTIVTNENPTTIKQWNSVKIFGPRPSTTSLHSGAGEGFFRSTDIPSARYIQRKGEYDAAIRRDTNAATNGITGKIMESRILYSTFVFDGSTFDKLNFIEIKSNSSIVQ